MQAFFQIQGPFQMSTPARATSYPDDPALLRIEGAIATITLNRPSAFNSIDLSIAKKLEQLSTEVEASDDIRVLVIEGEGRAFCAGGDLQTMGAAAAADTIAPVVGELLKYYHAFIATLRRMPKIVLASVHGSAAGAGLRSPLWRTYASRVKTPDSRRLIRNSAYRRTAAAPSAWLAA
jgi:1,4-dihydroxy-2-naphthoyl-CoA synthase